MRLIDADKLQDDGANYSYDKSENFGVIGTEYRFVNRVQIENAPTIEAIPIEWIKRYIDSTLDDGNSQMLGFKASIIKEMIEGWENENE